MFDLLKKIYYKIENLKGRRLYIFLFVIIVVFIIIGILIGYFTSGDLNQNEVVNNKVSKSGTDILNAELTGKVQYVDPAFYPDDDISFLLADENGKTIVLLKSSDQKLEIAEGLTVTVTGKKSKTKDRSEDVLIVREVIFKNVTD